MGAKHRNTKESEPTVRAARFLFFVTLISFSAIGNLSAQGSFDIGLTSLSGLSGNTAAEAAFLRAANQWEAFITDPISVSIDANFALLAPERLASAAPVALAAPTFNTFRDQIVVDSLNEPDDAITQFLPTATQLGFNLPAGFSLSNSLEATKANLKALGFTRLDMMFGDSDGEITFNSLIPYDFDNSDGVTPGTVDFETVAAHEIGHILGFTSAVDQVDSLINDGLAGAITATPFDLYRFEDGSINDPSTTAEFTTAIRSLLPGSDDVFDQVLGGPEFELATGIVGGDGQQASHFQDNLGLGVLDPSFGSGQVVLVSANDARVLDLIGYEVESTIIVGVPEPSTASLMMLLVSTALLYRRRV